MEETMKKCTKCGKEFPPTNEFFSKNLAVSDGLERWCKVCRKKAQADYRLKKAKETKDRNKPAARTGIKKSVRNTAPVVKKSPSGPGSAPEGSLPRREASMGRRQTDQLTGASPAEIVIALRKGMAAEIVAMIQERFEL